MSLSHIHGILNIFIKCHFSRMRTSIKLGLCVNILIAELRGMFVAHHGGPSGCGRSILGSDRGHPANTVHKVTT